MSTSAARDVVVLSCAISAGVHGALVPGHLDEGPGAGLAFAAAAVVLAVLAVLLVRRPAARAPVVAAAAALAGLIAAYAAAITTGLPLLHPAPEPVDALAVVTKAIEAGGLVTAWHLLRTRTDGRTARPVPLFLPALVAWFSALAALAATNGHHG